MHCFDRAAHLFDALPRAEQRKLIQPAGCPTTSLAPTTHINYDALNKLGWKLSCQAYTFREMSFFETLDLLQAMDIHYVELYPGQKLSKEHPELKTDHSMSEDALAQLQNKLAETHIKAVNYGVVDLPNDEAKARKVFDFAKKLGLETIVAEPPEDAFEMLDKLCNEYQINIAIHDHPKPSHYWNPDLVLKVSEGRSHRIGSCSDVGHWLRSGLVPLDCIKKLEGRIISFHFKDLNDEKLDVPWGTGKCDIKGILEELKRQKFHGVFSAEYERQHGHELASNVAKSYDYFSEVATDLAKDITRRTLPTSANFTVHRMTYSPVSFKRKHPYRRRESRGLEAPLRRKVHHRLAHL